MAPQEPARPGSSHTAVKHELLVRYLDVWTPTVLHAAKRVGYAEGYAGTGVESGREDGSAGAALRVFGEFADRLAGRELQMVLVEADPARLDALAGRLAGILAELGSPAELILHAVRGSCADDLVPALRGHGALPGPVFGYLDASAADPPPFQVVAAIAEHRASEVLVVLDPALLSRLAGADEPEETGDRLFGGAAWRAVGDQPAGQRYASLVTAYRESLRRAGLGAIVHVELVDAAGAAQLVFFGTRSAKNLEKFKTELWAVDEYAGVRYRDPRDREQDKLDISVSPSLGPLRRSLLDHIAAGGSATVAELRQHTLAETMYRPTEANRAISALLAAGAVGRDPAHGRLAADTRLRAP